MSNIYTTRKSSSLHVSPLYISPFPSLLGVSSFQSKKEGGRILPRIEAGQFKRPKARTRSRGLSKRKIVGAAVTRPAHWARTGTKGSCPATRVHGSIKPWAKFRRRIPRVCVDEEGTRLTIANNLRPILETSCKCLLTERTSPLYSLLGK